MTVQLLTSRPTGAAVASPTSQRLADVHRLAWTIARRNWTSHDVDDLAQRATIAYWETFGTGGGPASLEGWLKRVIDRLATGDYRGERGRRGTRQHIPPEVREEQVNRIMRYIATPSGKVTRRDLIDRAFGLLNGRDRQIMGLRLAGYSARDIAEQLDLRPLTVDRAYARAKRQLKLALEADPKLLAELRSL